MSDLRPARAGTTVIFLVAGLVSATWAARIPATQERLQLSHGDLGLVVLSIEAGALLGLPAGGVLANRLGVRWSLQLGFAIYPTLLLPMALAPTLGRLAVLLVVWAAANSLIDAVMNATGVERRNACVGRRSHGCTVHRG